MEKAYEIIGSGFILIRNITRATADFNRPPERCQATPRGFFIAHFPALRVTRRGESVPWVVSSYPNRPLAKRITTPAMCDKNGLAKINPDAAFAKSLQENWQSNKKGVPLYASSPLRD